MTTASLRITALILLILFTGTSARAGSIWAKAGCQVRALHTDDTARQIGDILTIVISEHSVIANEVGRGMKKKSSRNVDISGSFDPLDVEHKKTGSTTGSFPFKITIPEIKLDGTAESKFDGSADYDSDRKMEDRITVTVADVLPNGNLVVVGSRRRSVAGDEQIMQISGVVRTSDITFANIVPSDKVAEFRIVFTNKGRENRFTRPGWLDELLNIINTF